MRGSMKISKEASRKIPAALGMFLILELCFGNTSVKIAEFFNKQNQPSPEQTEVKNGR